MWEARQRAKMRLLGYLEVLDGKVHVPSDSSEYLKEDELQIRKINDEIYADLMLSITDPTCFNLLMTSRTEALQEGDAALAWRILKEKFNSTNKASKITMIKEYNNCRLEKDMDPDSWITKMENLRWTLQHTHQKFQSDEEFLTQLICNLNKDYSTLITSLEEQLDRTVDQLTIDRFKEQMSSFYKRSISSRSSKKHDSYDSVLMTDRKKIKELEKKIFALTTTSNSSSSNYKSNQSSRYPHTKMWLLFKTTSYRR